MGRHRTGWPRGRGRPAGVQLIAVIISPKYIGYRCSGLSLAARRDYPKVKDGLRLVLPCPLAVSSGKIFRAMASTRRQGQ